MSNENLVKIDSHIYINYFANNTGVWNAKYDTKVSTEIPFTKYTIKETDMRVKTANITTPIRMDLTDSVPLIKIISNAHPNFAGAILSDDYTENSDGTYTYQCQDFSRFYQSKGFSLSDGTNEIYRTLQTLITRGGIPSLDKVTSEVKNNWKWALSGLRPKEYYDQKLLGNGLNINPMTYKPKYFAKSVSWIERIRTLTIGTMRYIDVYFDEFGLLQIEPLSVKDWYYNGLQLSIDEISDRKIKFDTTNIITGALVGTGEGWDTGEYYYRNLLNWFFGKFYTTLTYKEDNTTTTTSTTTTTNTNSNPYGKKAKKAWINCDGGLTSKKNAIAEQLKKNGWSVHVGGTGPGYHYNDYWNVTTDYQCYITLYNGFCAGTMREAYSNKIQNVLNKKDVVLVPMWDSSGWTNPKGMKPYRYGDFSGYNAKRAWDDNFSSSDPSINNVGKWLKDNNAKYCCHPTTDGLVKQFLAGGYFASTGK